MKKNIKIEDISKSGDEVLSPVEVEDLVPLPPPYDTYEQDIKWKEISDEQKERLVCNLDGVVALNLPHPENEEEEKKYVELFISGLYDVHIHFSF